MDNEQVLESTQLLVHAILVKNTKRSREFIQTWLKWCENERAITDAKS